MKIESDKNRLILGYPRWRSTWWGAVSERKEGRRWGLRRSLLGRADGHRSGEPSSSAPACSSLPFQPVPSAALMDARLQQQGHSLTPHDVSPQPPLSNAQLLTAWEEGGRAQGSRRCRRQRIEEKGKSVTLSIPPSSLVLPWGNEVCILYQR